jgi:hypothetical protein
VNQQKLVSWRLVFDGTRKFQPEVRRPDAQKIALAYGYPFYLWVNEVFWTETDTLTSITREDLF